MSDPKQLYELNKKVPVLAVIDPNTDVGKVIVDCGFGWWCESNATDEFKKVATICQMDYEFFHDLEMRGYKELEINYNSEVAYKTIVEKCQ